MSSRISGINVSNPISAAVSNKQRALGKAELGTENESKAMSLIQMVAWTKEGLYPTSPEGSVVVVPLQLALTFHVQLAHNKVRQHTTLHKPTQLNRLPAYEPWT